MPTLTLKIDATAEQIMEHMMRVMENPNETAERQGQAAWLYLIVLKCKGEVKDE